MQKAATTWLFVLLVGFLNPGFVSAQCVDLDMDGFETGPGCLDPDCDDDDPSEFPGQVWYADCDADGFERSVAVISCDASEAASLTPCADAFPPDGGFAHVAGTDCDDEDPVEFPGQSWYADCDADGFERSVAVISCDASEAVTPCADAATPDGGYSNLAGTDCDDENPLISPVATEIPGNGIDENCDGVGGPPLVPALGTPAWIGLCVLLIATCVWPFWKRRDSNTS